MKFRLLAVLLLLPLLAYAHGNEDHSKKDIEEKEDQKGMIEMSNNEESKEKKLQSMKLHLKAINRSYQTSVKPIFNEKCVDCHGVPEKYPWYYKVPGIKHIMDYDIRKAKEHLDMSNDFPFGGHGTPLSDLTELRKTVEGGSMPPLQYWIFHPSSRPTAEEKEIIFNWIDQSIQRIEK